MTKSKAQQNLEKLLDVTKGQIAKQEQELRRAQNKQIIAEAKLEELRNTAYWIETMLEDSKGVKTNAVPKRKTTPILVEK